MYILSLPLSLPPSFSLLTTVLVFPTVGRAASFRNRRGSRKGSLRGSLHGSFHSNRGNSSRGSSIRGQRGSKRGSFRVPPTGGVGKAVGGKVPPSNLAKPKVETKLDISLFYQVQRSPLRLFRRILRCDVQLCIHVHTCMFSLFLFSFSSFLLCINVFYVYL